MPSGGDHHEKERCALPVIFWSCARPIKNHLGDRMQNSHFLISISDPCVALQIEQAGWPRRMSILKWTYQLYLLCDCMERGCESVMTLL
jgi:hypothetical protein